MPDYQFTDPKTGLTLKVSGPEPPSEGLLAQLFADAAKKAPAVDRPVEKPHPEATIGPAIEGTAIGNGFIRLDGTPTTEAGDPIDTPITFGEFIDNPSHAVQRMIAITKKGLSDPRNTIPAAIGVVAGATGLMPRSFASTRGLPTLTPPATPAPSAPAPSTGIVQAIRQNIALDDVVEAIPGAKNAKALYRVGKGVVNAAQQIRKPVEPADAAAPTPAPAATASASGSTAATVAAPPAPKATTPTATPPKASAAKPAAAKTSPAATSAPSKAGSKLGRDELPSLDELHLTPAEITQGVKWHEQGVSPETILHRILQSRQLTARTKTETPDQAAAAVKQRNDTGRWGDEGYVK